MNKQETKLRSAYLPIAKELMPNPDWVHLRHEDVRSGGHPDYSLSGKHRTSWWEFKHATPLFESDLRQRTICQWLAHASYCRYVIWEETEDFKRTLIVHPKNVKFSTMMIGQTVEVEASCSGFNHRWLAEYMYKVHTT